jgi:hypothetical protein
LNPSGEISTGEALVSGVHAASAEIEVSERAAVSPSRFLSP